MEAGRNAAARPTLLPSLIELVPWTDRRNRFHPLRAFILALAILPGTALALRWWGGMLGAEPLNAAIHSTGFWAVWVLLASLAITPAKALGNVPNIVVVRRQLGNAAMAYAAIHLCLYATDQHWKLLTIASEILRRFYLTIGFLALLGLLVLAFTSTDGWARHLGRAWKRLHRVVYALTLLGLVHFVLQSKLDVSHALLASGVFAWLMLWRLLPAGQDRSVSVTLVLAGGAALLTLIAEYCWYAFGTRVDPAKAIGGELDISYGIHPAGQVLILGLLVTLLVGLRRLVERQEGWRSPVTAAVYALAGLCGAAAPWFFGWFPGMAVAAEPVPLLHVAAWIAALALLGPARAALASETWQRALDALLVAATIFEAIRLSTDEPAYVVWSGAALALAFLAFTLARTRSTRLALLALPAMSLLAYAALLATAAPPPA